MSAVLSLLGAVPLSMWALLAALAWGTYGRLDAQHWKKADQALEAKVAAAADVARETGRLLEIQTQKQQESHDVEIRTIAAQRDAALRSLRNRPAHRMPSAAAPACAGASPAGLSVEDASLVIGWAAEADQLRADYQACRAWVDTVTKP